MPFNLSLVTPAPEGVARVLLRAFTDVALTVLGFLLVAAAIALLSRVLGLDALQKMASATGGPAASFGSVKTYLSNLRDALIPLSIPIGGVGIVGGGLAYAVGNQMATRLIMGAGVGVGLTLLAPTIID